MIDQLEYNRLMQIASLKTGQPAPHFTLPDLTGRLHNLEALRGRIVIVNFWSAECPWCERADRELLHHLLNWDAQVVLLPIASNVNESREMIAAVAAKRQLPFVLLDEDHRVADLYGAQSTPHLFVVDSEGILRYQGALDDVNFRQRQPTRNYLQMAVEALIAGKTPQPAQTPPYGCAIVRYMS